MLLLPTALPLSLLGVGVLEAMLEGDAPGEGVAVGEGVGEGVEAAAAEAACGGEEEALAVVEGEAPELIEEVGVLVPVAVGVELCVGEALGVALGETDTVDVVVG